MQPSSYKDNGAAPHANVRSDLARAISPPMEPLSSTEIQTQLRNSTDTAQPYRYTTDLGPLY
eukprot:1799026-Rhodomonas_salina.1